MGELGGVGAALLSSLLGGTAVAGTRYAVGTIDPLALAMLRYGIGALCLAPVAVYSFRKLKNAADILASAALGALFFALFPYLFTLSLAHTTAARGSLALSSLPLLTLGLSIALGRETLSWRRLIGILLAIGGLAYALSPRLEEAVPTAWGGDLVMIAAACVGAIFNVLSRPYIQRIGALSFTALGICMGALLLAIISGAAGALHDLPHLQISTWVAVTYLGVVGCALTFLLWSIGIRLASPALVALTVTVNPITASALGAMYLGEPITQRLIAGLCAVLLGIAVATNALARCGLARRPHEP